MILVLVNYAEEGQCVLGLDDVLGEAVRVDPLIPELDHVLLDDFALLQ